MSMTHSDQHHHHQARRRTMKVTVARNLLLLLAGCLPALLVSPAGVAASAIPAASFPSTNGIANSASADGGGHRRAASCVAVHPILKRRGVDPIDMPIDPIPDLTLRHCEVPPGGGTCCTQMTEHKLALHAKTTLERNTKDNISKLSSVLGARAQRFNEFFEQLLGESKHEFHAMFKRTYGTIYEQNSYVFADLFAELERYYAHGKVDLSETMDHFFNILFQKMFTVLNAQYTFDTKYLGCVSEHMKELKPFGDVPDKLSVQIKRSFVATRTYAQALASAAEAAKNMINVRLSAECTAALTRMSTCNVCAGQTKKPCAPYCVNVMRGCLQGYDEVSTEWDTFVGKMERISERLLGPFNIVMVVEPIDIKISEAIMNFQENGKDISDRIFQGCGQPALGRMRRSLEEGLPNGSPQLITTMSGQQQQQQLQPQQLTLVDRATMTLPTGSDSFETDAQFTFEGDEGEVQDDGAVDQKHISKRAASNGGSSTADSTSKELKYEPMQFSDGDVQFTNSNGPPVSGSSSHHGSAGGGGGGGGRANRRKNKNGRKQTADDEQENQEPMLDRLVKDIRQKVRDSKRFWAQLPYMLCNNEEIAEQPPNDVSCWNGTTVDRYQPTIVSGEAESNPEFPTKPLQARPSTIVQQQLYVLRTAISHLGNAYIGHDVEWTDQEDGYYGSGSGHGGGIDYDDVEGSGVGLWEIDVRNAGRPPGVIDGVPPKISHDGGANFGGSSAGFPTDGNVGHGSTTNELDYTEGGSHSGLPGGGSSTGASGGAGGTSSAGGSHNMPVMSIERALLQFFLPIVMAWFGGLFADLL
ncbi:glypican-4 [Anopheles ziemanni]|uniref:glypican-4 n=1 Tax=Anopheles coustani TaxID=139045 RepID=UPI00265A7969|nr:glypican-4 [Anopheles coustani]XP_058169723.1 glypican-4 [Anopheles ziemanni]